MTEGKNAVLVVVALIAGLFLGVKISQVMPEGATQARVIGGFAGLIAPPAAALWWAQRSKK